MAEGGYDPDETGTFDPNDDDDDRTPLTTRHRGDEMEMKHRTSSPFIITKDGHQLQRVGSMQRKRHLWVKHLVENLCGKRGTTERRD